MNKMLYVTLCCWFFCGISANVFSLETSDHTKKRLNQIFYWRLADELKLSPKQESDLIATIERFQTRRENQMQERQNALKEKVDLKRYEQALNSLSQVEVDEYHALEAILGEQTLRKYLVVREQVFESIRQALKSK